MPLVNEDGSNFVSIFYVSEDDYKEFLADKRVTGAKNVDDASDTDDDLDDEPDDSDEDSDDSETDDEDSSEDEDDEYEDEDDGKTDVTSQILTVEDFQALIVNAEVPLTYTEV